MSPQIKKNCAKELFGTLNLMKLSFLQSAPFSNAVFSLTYNFGVAGLLPFPPRLWCFCTCFFSLRFPGDKREDLSVSSPSSAEVGFAATSVFCLRVWSLANGIISQSAGLCHTVVWEVAL